MPHLNRSLCSLPPLLGFAAAVLLCLAGCSSLSTPTQHEDADLEIPPPNVDAGDGDIPDGGPLDSDISDSDVPPPDQHDLCAEPLPDPLPSLPSINIDPTGAPRFDDWRDYPCDSEEVAGLACIDDADCEPLTCYRLNSAGEGVCTYADADIWCDGEGEAISYRDGACWACMPPLAHAAACCAGIAGVDCRAWPYPANGSPGMICARHEDCESGLLCGPHRGSGFGICQCPEVHGSDLVPAEVCW